MPGTSAEETIEPGFLTKYFDASYKLTCLIFFVICLLDFLIGFFLDAKELDFVGQPEIIFLKKFKLCYIIIKVK